MELFLREVREQASKQPHLRSPIQAGWKATVCAVGEGWKEVEGGFRTDVTARQGKSMDVRFGARGAPNMEGRDEGQTGQGRKDRLHKAEKTEEGLREQTTARMKKGSC
ncbi:unnamed protein product [Calypogeia fissa]